MSTNPSLPEIKASNALITPSNAPKTAIFIGATSGIGKATLTRLIAQGTPIKVYIIGRSAAKHQAFVDELKGSNNKATIIYLEGEVSLLADVKRLCGEIKKRESSVDAVFLSPGYIPYHGREKTTEDLDIFTALSYYCRLLFTIQLLPLLKASSNNPRIVHLGGAGNEVSNLFLDDLDLNEPGHYTMWNMINYAATAMTLTLSRLADENPDVVFIFNLPGLVPTDIHTGGTLDRWYAKPLLWFLGISVEDAGERSVFLLTSARFGGKGVPLQNDAKGLLTMKKTEERALFCVNQKLKGLQQESVMEKLESQGAGEKVWKRLQEVLAPYL